MREYILIAGQHIPWETLNRGPMFLWDREMWYRRYQIYLSNDPINNSIGFGVMIAAIILVPFLGFWLAVAIASLWWIPNILLMSMIFKDLNNGGAVPGIYKWGIEMPVYPIYFSRLFISWAEIEGIEVKRTILSGEVVYISVKDSKWKWRLPKSLIGDEGVILTKAILGITPPIPLPEVDPPRLVLHTTDGGRQTSYPEGNEVVPEDASYKIDIGASPER